MFTQTEKGSSVFPADSFSLEEAVKKFIASKGTLVTGFQGQGANYQRYIDTLKIINFFNTNYFIKENIHGSSIR